MSQGSYTRSSAKVTEVYDSGPYEAIIVNHLDTKYMGGLEVEIIRYTGAGGTPERSGQLMNVRYLSPFYGVTPTAGLTANDGYENTQKSYGMWMVPPDVGSRVLVIFAEGNANFGYWIGCIPDDYMNFMVPDGRPSTQRTTEVTPQNLKGAKLPVGEYNKKIEDGTLIDPTLFNKPYNKDFTNILEVQGLLYDEVRGTTTTSARREIPSSTFGINTPGPLDKRAGAPRVDIGAAGKKANVPYNRLGGSSVVMDDGNDKFIRKTHAEDGPPLYVNKLSGEEGGDETIPHNELMRFRTRTGHQILLHNSEDLIYISNSRGTAWIELTSDGKIDIHAQDSISVMSENDINFTAERDFNIEAGRNINMKASARWSDGQAVFDDKPSGRVHIESTFDTRLYAGKDYKLTVKGTSDTSITQGMKTTVGDDYNLHSKKSYYMKADNSVHEKSEHSWYRESGSDINDLSGSTKVLAITSPDIRNGAKYVIVFVGTTDFTAYGSPDNEIGTCFIMANKPGTGTGTVQLVAGTHYIKGSGINIHSSGCGGDLKIFVKGNMETVVEGHSHASVTGEVHLISDANIRHQSADDYSVISAATINNIAAANINTKSDASIFVDAASEINNLSGAAFKNTAGGDFSIGATNTIISGGDINLNGPAAPAASAASSNIDAANIPIIALTATSATKTINATDATPIEPLPTITLPYMFPGALQPVPYDSILTRAPTHEPYMHHENMNPAAFKKEQTDREVPGPLIPSDRIETPDVFNKNKAASTSSRVIVGSGGNTDDFDGGTGDGPVNSDSGSTGPNAAGQSDATFDSSGPEGKLVTITAKKSGKTAQVAEVFAANFQAFLDEFEQVYEIKALGGYAKRQAVGSSSWSCHASGAAIDLNWPNPVFNTYPNGFYKPRPANAPMTDMPANTKEIANKHGLGWGGAWNSLDDAMHFSAHTSEGGSFRFDRNGKIPKGPSNFNETQTPIVDEELGNDLNDPEITDNEANNPGPQNSDGTDNNVE